ncbi:MAG: hypothetical protein Q9M94_04985 [Candidatus Gracilibacteria bacterium]|nr:hypothetical protein [Candidatus Gracilibacteria bacterium]
MKVLKIWKVYIKFYLIKLIILRLEKYFKIKFNKPVLEMISMLNKFEKLLEKQINLLKITKSNTDVSNLTLDKKEISLNHQLDILRSNKSKLKGSVM